MAKQLILVLALAAVLNVATAYGPFGFDGKSLGR